MIQIHQEMLSQAVVDWQLADQMLDVNSIDIQAEFFKCVTNKEGQEYTGGVTPWSYFETHIVKPFAYFDFMWPNPWSLSPEREPENDPYWLRKKHINALYANPGWTRPSPVVTRHYSNTADPAYCNFLVDLLLETGIPRWRFDDCHISKHPKAVVDGMFWVFDELRMAGCEVWANNAWEMDNPNDAPGTWGYPAFPHLDGVMVEHWAGHNDGFSFEGDWWALSDDRFMQMQRDWVDANKGVMMLVRWRPNETLFDSYDRFCRHYIQLSESVFVPALHNYQYPNWIDWFKTYQQPTLNIQEVVMRECDLRQQIFLQVGAALQKRMHAEGFTPVLNEFRYSVGSTEYIMQKGERTGEQEERYYFADVKNYNDVISFTKPH